MKIELTIKVDYLPEWGAYEGLRELLQNGQDAKVEMNAPLSVRYRKESSTVVIENEGSLLPHEALLLGHTTKTDRTDLIGKFGEGLKLGVLALVRAGHSVKIRSGSEVWTPSIQRSDKFNADVLVFEIGKGRSEKSRVQVEVGGIDVETWDRTKECFLFLLDPSDLDKTRVYTTYGDLLIGEKYAGKLFVKGIFVQNDPSMRYGYNFRDAEIDRDRKMIAKWDLQYKCRSIWAEAANKRPDLIEVFSQMLDQQASDLEGIDEFSARYLPDQVKTRVVSDFKAKHGESAMPVASLSESKDIEHLGRKGVVAPKSLKAVLEAVLGTADQVKTSLKREAVKTYSWGDLGDIERGNLETAIRIISEVAPITLDDVDVIEFRDEKILGLWKDKRIMVAYKMLAERKTTMRVLVHELGHKLSSEGDGTKDHTDVVETMWADILEKQLDKSMPR